MKANIVWMTVLIVFISGCTSVSRKDEKDVIDLSGNWNDTDSQMVADEMIKDSLNRRWIHDHQVKHEDKKPVVVVGFVRNNTAEHINTEPFTKSLERAFTNSGNVDVVANSSDREELRNEIKNMRGNVTPNTMKKLGQQLGADYLLIGVINDIVDQEKSKRVQYYQVNLELVHLVSHRKVWIGEKKIKKLVKKSKFGLF